MRRLALALCLLSTGLAAQPDTRPMTSVASRAEVCPAPCRVVQRMRVGSARVQVLRQGRRDTTFYLFVRQGGRSWAHVLGGNGPAFGSDEGVSYSFDRLERADADGDPSTHEVVALAGGPDSSAVFCQVDPMPCCAFSVVAARGADRRPIASTASPIGYCP